MYINKGLSDFKKKLKVNLSMPGHKWRIPIDIKDDVTEFPGLDNLNNPDGIIKKSEEYTAKIYGVKYAQYQVNGSTGGNLSMIHGLLRKGDEVIVERNSHKSIYSALSLRNYNCHFLYNKDYQRPSKLENIKNLVEKFPKTKAVIMTSPTYMGYRADLKNIYAYLKEKDIMLLVDGAHGAHLILKNCDDYKYATAMSLSFHKTMGSINQGAAVFTNDESTHIKVREASKLFQTTSPSYIILKSIEDATMLIEKNKDKQKEKNTGNNTDNDSEYDAENDAVINYLEELNSLCSDLKHIKITGEDFTKAILTLDSKGEYIFSKLVKEGIHPELHTFNHVLLMFSPYNTKEEILIVAKALKKIDEKIVKIEVDHREKERESEREDIKYDEVESKVTLGEAIESKMEYVELDGALDKISGSFITPYPPGIPLVVPGEVINKNIIDTIKDCFKNGLEVVGMEDKKVRVIYER